MDIERNATVKLEGDPDAQRLRDWAAEHRFTILRHGPPVWELRRGNRLLAGFSFDIKTVPTTIVVDTSGPEASCSLRARSLAHLASKADRAALEYEFGSLTARLRGEPAPPAPPPRSPMAKILLFGVAALSVIVLVVVLVADRWQPAPVDQPASSNAKLALFERARRATVLVYGEETGNAQAWKGSAVIVAKHPRCYVALTNAHVLKSASEASLSLQYGTTKLFVIGRTAERGETSPIRVSHAISTGFTRRGIDLGLLILPGELPLEVCQPAAKGPEDGQWVFAVGHPQQERWFAAEGVAQSVTTHAGATAIPHTALISGGSSGGGLFDSHGRLLGINTWSATRSHLTRPTEPVGIAISVKELAASCDIYYREIDSCKEWQPTGIRLSRGQMISVAAIGEWRLGGWAGSCGAAGMAGHEGYSFATEYPHGCLLVKDNGPYIRIPELSYARSDGGELQFRINDKDLGNNSGVLGVVVVCWK